MVCVKYQVTKEAILWEEIINYVQSLQSQVEVIITSVKKAHNKILEVCNKILFLRLDYINIWKGVLCRFFQ